MLAVPATAPLHRLCQMTLDCIDRPDLPARIAATCARRGAVVMALAFARGRPDGRASLELCVDVDPDRRRLLVGRLEGLVDVVGVEVRG